MVFTGTYAIPVSGDKIFRSPRHGQQQLRAILGVKKIIVDDRSNTFVNTNGIPLVKVLIIADTKRAADGCFEMGKAMILKCQGSNPVSPVTSKKFFYDVPVDGDKVFRSPKHGQVYLKQKYPDCRIRVGDRVTNNPMVRLIITAPTQTKANALYNEGMVMVRKIIESLPKKEPVRERTDDELLDDWIKQIVKLVQTRESMGIDDHTECPEVMELISMREDCGIVDHSSLGMAWEKRDFVWADDLFDITPEINNLTGKGSWAAYDELRQEAKELYPQYYISG